MKTSGKEEDKKLFERSDKFHSWVMSFAQKHSEYRVVIKTKFAEHYVQYIKNIKEEFGEAPISNLTITNIGNPAELIINSTAIIGFNSTTLFEAIANNKTIITPYFGDIVANRKKWDFFSDYPMLVNYAKSYNELEGFISNADISHSYNSEVRDKFLEELIYKADGKACVRTEQAIIGIIKECK